MKKLLTSLFQSYFDSPIRPVRPLTSAQLQFPKPEDPKLKAMSDAAKARLKEHIDRGQQKQWTREPTVLGRN